MACEYCRIHSDYVVKPREYPQFKHYVQNEKPVAFWMDIVKKLYNQNPEVFIILYGGEPLLYSELPTLINYLNDLNVNYTIISNCDPKLKDVREELFDQCGTIKGFTASIDPSFEKCLDVPDNVLTDDKRKSKHGFLALKDLLDRGLITDPVAEMTADCDTIFFMKDSIKILTAAGICSDVTVLDWSPNNFYDFSAITNPKYLVPKTEEVKAVFDDLISSDLNIHMKDSLLPAIYKSLPAEVECNKIQEHNISIDADGKLRLCLRIRGKYVSSKTLDDLLNNKEEVDELYQADKDLLCKKCSWTCVLMSQLDQDGVITHK